MSISKENAIVLLNKSAIEYQNNLAGNNVLFLAFKKNRSEYIESTFIPSNFLHLTGVDSMLDPIRFFEAAYDNRLSENDIAYKKDGTTELKLSVLLKLMNIHKIAKMLGDYDYSGRQLVADKLAGTTASVMGFIKDGEYYYPNSVLKENLSNIAVKPYCRILATFIKPLQDKQYTKLSYAVNDKEVFTDNVLSIIKGKVDFINLKASFPVPWETGEQA